MGSEMCIRDSPSPPRLLSPVLAPSPPLPHLSSSGPFGSAAACAPFRGSFLIPTERRRAFGFRMSSPASSLARREASTHPPPASRRASEVAPPPFQRLTAARFPARGLQWAVLRGAASRTVHRLSPAARPQAARRKPRCLSLSPRAFCPRAPGPLNARGVSRTPRRRDNQRPHDPHARPARAPRPRGSALIKRGPRAP